MLIFERGQTTNKNGIPFYDFSSKEYLDAQKISRPFVRQLTKKIAEDIFVLAFVVIILTLVCKFIAVLCRTVPSINHPLPIKYIREIKYTAIARISVSPNSGH